MLETQTVAIADQPLKIGIHRGSARLPPLLFFNGIGANLELIEPLAAALQDIEVIERAVQHECPLWAGRAGTSLGVRRCGLEHDPEKWIPVFGKDHAPTIS